MHGPRQHVVTPVTRFTLGVRLAEAAKTWLAGTDVVVTLLPCQLGRVVLPRMRQADSTLQEP